jgi:putative signal transducing protein
MTDPDPRELVTVFATGDPVLIATAKLVLEAADIRFLTKGEGIQDLIGLGRMFGGFNLATGPVQIQVERRDAARAIEALRDVRSSPDA